MEDGEFLELFDGPTWVRVLVEPARPNALVHGLEKELTVDRLHFWFEIHIRVAGSDAGITRVLGVQLQNLLDNFVTDHVIVREIYVLDIIGRGREFLE